MSNTKEYFNQLDATLVVEELNDETSATIQGGVSLKVFDYGTNRRLSGTCRNPQSVSIGMVSRKGN